MDYFNLNYLEKLQLSNKAKLIGKKVNEKSGRILLKTYRRIFGWKYLNYSYFKVSYVSKLSFDNLRYT